MQDTERNFSPVEIAFGIQPRHVEPGRRVKGGKLLVVIGNVCTTVVDQWSEGMSKCAEAEWDFRTLTSMADCVAAHT